MIIITALLGGGAVLLSLQLQSSKSAGVVKSKVTGLTCAESGLAIVRTTVAANYANWTAALCNPPPPRGTGSCVIGSPASEPPWLSMLSHDIDGDGTPDFVITLIDNDDEVPSNMAVNSDQDVTIVSTCVMQPDSPTRVLETVHYDIVTGTLSRKLWIHE